MSNVLPWQSVAYFTDCYLFNAPVLAQISCAVDQLLARPGVNDILNDDSSYIDIVLELTEESSTNEECGYYFVDHSEPIFWADVFNMHTLERWDIIPGIETASHANAMTSSTTTICYSVDHLSRMLALTREMMSELSSHTCESSRVNLNRCSGAIFARFMGTSVRLSNHTLVSHYFFSTRAINHFHGEKTARLCNRQSVYGYDPKRSYLFTMVSPLLFNAPLRQIHSFESVNMDNLVSYSSWQKLVTTFRSEWQDLVLYVRRRIVYDCLHRFPCSNAHRVRELSS
ncbi:hypothetical protein DFH06DRAFT_1194721 [Mycena polygramma]|nr:hypothetical protein DFH06DRAFT_1194721 [Mycena polygramma]